MNDRIMKWKLKQDMLTSRKELSGKEEALKVLLDQVVDNELREAIFMAVAHVRYYDALIAYDNSQLAILRVGK